jgi:hypothetical protein
MTVEAAFGLMGRRARLMWRGAEGIRYSLPKVPGIGFHMPVTENERLWLALMAYDAAAEPALWLDPCVVVAMTR